MSCPVRLLNTQLQQARVPLPETEKQGRYVDVSATALVRSQPAASTDREPSKPSSPKPQTYCILFRVKLETCFLLTVWATGGENYSVTLSIFFWAATQCLCSCSFCEHYQHTISFINHEEHKLYVQKQKPWLSLCGAVARAILELIPDFTHFPFSSSWGTLEMKDWKPLQSLYSGEYHGLALMQVGSRLHPADRIISTCKWHECLSCSKVHFLSVKINN